MSTSATILANRQDSYFTIWSNKTSGPAAKFLSTNFLDQAKPEIAERKIPFKHVLQFFSNTEIVNTVENNVLPAGNLYYKDSLILKFSLTEKYAGYFPLLRGLFGFGKLTGLTISSSNENKTFQVVISSGREENVIDYFGALFSELARELKFKRALKDLLHIQKEVIQIEKAGLLKLGKAL